MDLKTFLILLAIYVASGLLNMALQAHSAEEWQALAESSPRTHKAMKLLRQFGLDLPGVVRLVRPALASLLARYGGKGGAQ